MDDSQIDLRGVDLTDVKDILDSAKCNSDSADQSEIVITQEISVWTISIIVIMTLSALTIVIVKFKTFSKDLFKRRNHLEPKDLPPADFSLKGVGVKGSHPVDLCFVSTNSA